MEKGFPLFFGRKKYSPLCGELLARDENLS
jgi:hypothetical protein